MNQSNKNQSNKNLIITVIVANVIAFFLYIFSALVNMLGSIIGLKKRKQIHADEYLSVKKAASTGSTLTPSCTGRIKRGEWDTERNEWLAILHQFGIKEILHAPFLKHFKYRTNLPKDVLERNLRDIKNAQKIEEDLPAIKDFLLVSPNLDMLRDKIPLINAIRAIPTKEVSDTEILADLPWLLGDKYFGTTELELAREHRALYDVPWADALRYAITTTSK